LIGDKAVNIQVGVAAGEPCNILIAEENLVELISASDKLIRALRNALPFLSFVQSQESGQ
jgi:hypothetical protein